MERRAVGRGTRRLRQAGRAAPMMPSRAPAPMPASRAPAPKCRVRVPAESEMLIPSTTKTASMQARSVPLRQERRDSVMSEMKRLPRLKPMARRAASSLVRAPKAA